MLIHQQHQNQAKYYPDSISGASSLLTHSSRPSVQIVFSQLKDNRFVIENSNKKTSNISSSQSSSTFRKPVADRKIIINKIEFDYLNRVTKTITEEDLKKHAEREEAEKTENEKALSSDSDNLRRSSTNFTRKTKNILFNGNNDILPGYSKKSSTPSLIAKSNQDNYGHKSPNFSQNENYNQKKKSLIDLDLVKANRKSLVHSAPAKIVRNRKSSVDSNYSTTSSSASSDLSSNSGDDHQTNNEFLRSRPKSSIRYSSLSANVKNDLNSIQNTKEYKTIMREQEQIFTKTMSVDKWVAIHKRPRTSTSFSSSQNNNNNQSQQLSVTFSPNTEEKNKLSANQKEQKEINSQIDVIFQRQKQLQQLTKRVRSVKELSQLNLIDNIQTRIKKEVQDTLKKKSRDENFNHFNSIVERVRSFLYQVEEFNEINNPVIKLYEYNINDN
jgi:hypothetical protein